MRDPKSGGNETKYLSHDGSFIEACQNEELYIVNAMVERTQVNSDVSSGYIYFDRTPLHEATDNGHLPMVQYLCEKGADKEARDVDNWTPLHGAARDGHLPWRSTCVSTALTRRQGIGMAKHHCVGQHSRGTSLGCSTCVSRGLTRRRWKILACHHCTWQHYMVTSMWCNICASRALTKRRGM